jgi:pimeloyl-ACP methyl ester carboxylesterase
VSEARVRAHDGVELHVVQHGDPDARALVLLHGFPELGFSWRHQVPALVDAGYRVLVPDLRGFGLSDAPEATEAYAIDSLSGDVLSLLDHAGVERGIVIGHDWGADVAWKTAWMHPERVAAVAGLSVPFVPRAPAPPIGLLRQGLGPDFYIVWFQEPGAADEAMAKDVRRTLASTKVWTDTWARDEEDDPPTPRFMTEEELAVYVRAFERTGFTGGLAYYRNIDRNWELTEPFGQRRIEQPALFIAGERDPVLKFMPAEAMDGWVLDLRAKVVVPGAGHWVNQEEPRAVNEALVEWLSGLDPGAGT